MTPHQAAPGGSRQSGAGISRSGAHTPRQWPVEGAVVHPDPLGEAPRDYDIYSENWPYPIAARESSRLSPAARVMAVGVGVLVALVAIGWAVPAVAGWWS